MPKYAALIYRVEAEWPEQGSPASQQLYQAWGAFNQDVARAGVMSSGTGLQPTATATSVRVREGKTLITDGPFAETREQLGGILIFDCEDLDEDELNLVALGRDRQPARMTRLLVIRALLEPEYVCVELECLVLVADDNRRVGQFHCLSLHAD